MAEHILVIEDETRIADLLRRGLTYEGFRVSAAGDGQSGLAMARDDPPDLVILDWMLPGLDGLEVCKRIRAAVRTSIMMLTAKDAVADRVHGLDAGADDYVVKPFSFDELVARVRTVLRRTQGALRLSGVLRAADLEIFTESHRLTRAGVEVSLSRIEFNLLVILAQHPGQIFSRAQLLDRLHGVAFEGFERSIDAHIKNLRRKLEPDPAEPRYVLTVYGIGYKFNEELQEIS